jgi:hypothetical protein
MKIASFAPSRDMVQPTIIMVNRKRAGMKIRLAFSMPW